MNAAQLVFTLASLYLVAAPAFAEHDAHKTGPAGRAVAPDLRFSGVSVDKSEMIRLSKLGLRDLMSTLRREYGLVVISIDEWGQNAKAGQPEAEAALQEAYRFYWSEENRRQHWTISDAMFVQPHQGLNREAKTEKDFPERPFSDKPLILVDSGSSVYTVLHEFMHFLIWNATKQEPIALNGKTLAPVSWHQIQRNIAVAEMTSLSVANANTTPEQKQRQLQEKREAELRAVLHAYSFANALTEELDITRWMYENADQIGLDEEAKKHSLLYHQKSLQDFLKIHQAVRSLMESPGGTVLMRGSGEEGRKTARALQDAQNRVLTPLRNDFDWFNSIDRDQSEDKKR